MQKIRGYRICTNRVKKHNIRLRSSQIKNGRSKKFFSSLKRLGGIITIISVVISGVKIYDYVMTSQKFNIKNITITYSNKEFINRILRENNIVVGRNIFKVGLKDATKLIMQNSNLTNVKIGRKLPDTVIVTAEDRIPIAYIGEKKIYQIDKEYVITLSNSENKDNIPVIFGCDVSPEEIGKKTDNKDILTVLKLLKDINNYIINNANNTGCIRSIVSIDISNPDYMEAKTSDKISIVFGDGEFDRKIKRLEALFVDLAGKGKKAISVDLRFRNEAAVRLK